MKKIVDYTVNGEEWTKAKDEAFAKIQKKAKVDGFRQGKVPRNIFEKKYGTKDIISEAMEKIIDDRYNEAYVNLLNEKKYPVIEPKLDIVTADDNELVFKVIFVLEPEVTLGEYKGLKVKKDKVKVTKEEVSHQVGHILDRYAELVSKDGKVENGDTVIIDFKGFKDNEAFEGGSADNYTLEIGSHSFIPGFEEGIIGMKKEENKDITLTFPEDYFSEELKGQEVVFNVTLHDIKKRVIPDLDEEFFKDLDMEGVTNKEELDKVVEEEIKTQKEYDAENKFTSDLLEKATGNMTIDLDKEIIDDEALKMYAEFVERLKMQGVSEELYFTYSGTTKEKVVEDLSKAAEKRLKNYYLLTAIVKEEKIEVSDEDAKKDLKELAEKHNITEKELLKEFDGSMEKYKQDLTMRKAIEILKENN